MYCPKCGSNQGEGKKFCTICGTNLQIVSQALSGQLPPPTYQPPVIIPQTENKPSTREELAKGIMMALIGGLFLLYQLLNFIINAPFFGWRSPFNFLSFVALIFFALGLSKIISFRMAATPQANTGQFPGQTTWGTTLPNAAPSALQQPVFASAQTVEPAAPRTSELEPVRAPGPSVTEDDTRHLPQQKPQQNFPQ